MHQYIYLDWHQRTERPDINTYKYVWNEFQIVRNEISTELIAISFKVQ